MDVRRDTLEAGLRWVRAVVRAVGCFRSGAGAGRTLVSTVLVIASLLLAAGPVAAQEPTATPIPEPTATPVPEPPTATPVPGADGHAGPAHGHTGPTHSHAGPAHGHTGPTHSHAGPAHGHTGPTHSHAGPAHGHTGPTYRDAGPSPLP